MMPCSCLPKLTISKRMKLLTGYSRKLVPISISKFCGEVFIIKAIHFFLFTRFAAITVGNLIMTKLPGTDIAVSETNVAKIPNLYKN